MRWPKYWSFSFSIIPSKEIPGLISFRMDWLDLLCSPRDSQESSPTPQFKSINSSALGFLHSPTLTSISLLQGIFPTQELNWSLLHCRQILYHLSQGWTDNRDLFPVLLLQFILSLCANGILFSLFSVDEIVNFLGCLDCSNKIPWIEWLRKNEISFSHLWTCSLEVRGLVWLVEGPPPGHKLLLVI